MTELNFSQSVKNDLLKRKDAKTKVKDSQERSKNRTTAEEKEYLQKFGKVGSFVFPIIVVLFSGYGLGEMAAKVIPEIPAYIATFSIAIFVEYGQYIMARPLTKLIAFQSNIENGEWFRGLFFTFLSVSIGMVGFFSVVLKQNQITQADSKNKYAIMSDSLTNLKKQSKKDVQKQIDQLNAGQAKRWAGMLTQPETKLLTDLNSQSKQIDSVYTAQIATVKKTCNIDQPKRLQKFDFVEFSKWLIALFIVSLVGFLSIYSHYLYNLYDYLVCTDVNKVVGFDVREQMSLHHAFDVYTGAIQLLPNNEQMFTPVFSNQVQPQQTGMMQNFNSVPTAGQRQQAPQPTASTPQRIGFRFGTNATAENTPNAADVGGYVPPYVENVNPLLGEAICEYHACRKKFVKRVFNQKYCNEKGDHACRKLAEFERNGVYNGLNGEASL